MFWPLGGIPTPRQHNADRTEPAFTTIGGFDSRIVNIEVLACTLWTACRDRGDFTATESGRHFIDLDPSAQARYRQAARLALASLDDASLAEAEFDAAETR